MADSPANTPKTLTLGTVTVPGIDQRSRMPIATWSSLFKNPRGLLDLPTEIVDVILGYTCSNWGVQIIQKGRMDQHHPGAIVITPHPESIQNTDGLIQLAATNSLLYEHLQRCLHVPVSFSGYTQLINITWRDLACAQGKVIILNEDLGAFSPYHTPETFLKWVLQSTTVLEIRGLSYADYRKPVDPNKICPKLERIILDSGLHPLFTSASANQIRDIEISKVMNFERSNDRWGRAIRQLIARGIRITFRPSVVHPSRWGGMGLSETDHSAMYPAHWGGRGLAENDHNSSSKDFHPMILSMDIKAVRSDPTDISVRPGRRDFHSPCCPAGRLDDPTIKFAFAELAARGFQFKHKTSQRGQPCDMCRHWRLMWSGVNGDRKRFDDKEMKASTWLERWHWAQQVKE